MKKWKKVMSIVMVIAMAMNSQSVWAASIEDENVSQNQYISTPEEVSNDEKTDDNRLVGNTSGPYTYTIPGTTINLYYTIDGSGNATMSGCDEYAVDIEIPSMINGHKVVCIGGSSFAGRPNLVSVKIPDSVSSIEEDAFFNCSKLMSVNIPDSVTSIGNGAFDSCTSLISIFLPDSVSNLGKFVFSNCSRLGSIDVSESNPDYSSINGILFTKNSGILKICPAGLDVGNYSIPESVNTIEDYAFIQCKKLTAINIPATVKKVGIDAFNGCSGLTTVAIPDSLTAVSNGMFDGCTGLTSVTLPDSITSITARAFCDCSSLASITIPASVSFIGGRAFDGCSSLISIDIPEQVTAIGFGAFEGCTNLSHVTIPNSVTVIENDVFHNCSNLKDITIPVSVTAIRRFAFEGCASLTDIYFSGSKENWNNISIEEYNDNLKSATIHYNTYSIKKNGTYLLRIIDEATSELINNATLTYNGTDYHTDSAGNVQFQVSEASEHTSGTVSISAFPYTTKTADLNSLNPYKCNIINLESSISTPDLNLNLGSTNVDGPKISIYKWKFPLFSLKAEVNIDALHLHVERSIDRSDKTIRYLFGYETDNKDSDNDSYWKTTYANIKDIVNGFGKRTDRQFYNDFRKLRKNLKSQDIKLGVELNGNILGYYESSYAGGKNTFKEGGIVVTAEAALDVQKRIEATADILYAHFRLEGEAQGKYALVLDDTNINDQKLLFEIETKLEFRLKLGIGAGMPAIACAEGGAQGTVTFDIKVYPPKVPALSEAMEIDSKLQLYLKLSLFSIFDKTYNWPSDKDATFELYPEVGWKNSLAGDGLVGSSENADDFTISDYDNYALTPRDYLNAKDSGQDGTSTPLVGASSGLSASYEENNVFPYGSPQVVALSDGRMMAFWIGDNGGSSSANRTQLMCAVRSTDGAWGNAQAVCADGKADFLPCVCADGNKCYVVWRKATETYPEDITVTGMASKLKLVMSIFDGTSFSDLKTVVDDGLYPQFPSLDAHSGNAVVSWVENSDNEPYMATGTNSLYICNVSNGTISSRETLSGNLGYVSSIAADASDSSVCLSRDNDGDPTTTGDSDIYRISSSGETNLTADAVDDSNLKNIGGVLYWSKGGELYSCSGGAVSDTGAICGNAGAYRVMAFNNTTTVLTKISDGLKSELYTSSKTNDTWSTPVALTSYGGAVTSFDAAADAGGNPVIALDKVPVDENYAQGTSPYGNTSFVITNANDRYDLDVNTTLYYDESQATAGNTITLTADVTNNSTQPVTNLKVSLLDAGGTVLSEENVNQTIAVGETSEVSAQYTPPDPFTTAVSMKVEADGITESDTSNNTASAEIGHCDFKAGEMSVTKNADGTGTVTVPVSNTGTRETGKITASLYRNGTDGDLLGRAEAGSLAAGDSSTLSFELTAAQMALTGENDSILFYMTADASNTENDYSDNTSEKLYTPPAVTGVSLDKGRLLMGLRRSKSLTVSVTPEESLAAANWLSDDATVVSVDNTGKVTGNGLGTANVTALAGSQTAQSSIKVFCPGDVTEDDETTVSDLQEVAKEIVGLMTFDEEQMIRGNYDEDANGEITISDLQGVAKYIVGLEK